MDSRKGYKKGDLVIFLHPFNVTEVYEIKYLLGERVVVHEHKLGFDIPLYPEYIIPCTPLMKELL